LLGFIKSFTIQQRFRKIYRRKSFQLSLSIACLSNEIYVFNRFVTTCIVSKDIT